EPDGQRHEVFGLAAGESEHHPLVAGAFLFGIAQRVLRVIDAAGDVGRLRVDRVQHAARVVAEADVLVEVADVFDGLADDLLDVHVYVRPYLAGRGDPPGRA